MKPTDVLLGEPGPRLVPRMGSDHFDGNGDSICWPPKYDTLGVKVSATTYQQVVDVLVQSAKQRRPAIVEFLPVSVLIETAQNPTFQFRLNSFDLVCPDGQPVRWCLNHFHRAGLRQTVNGTTATLRLCEAAARENIGVFLYGSTHETLRKLQANLLARFPTLQISGVESPPFSPLSPREKEAAAHRINASGAGFVFVGIGSPRQENFAWEQKSEIKAVQLCVGAAFDFIAGTKKRAPEWMQKAGLEWAHRLCSEPVRLGKRYVLGNSRFAVLVARELIRSAVQYRTQACAASRTRREM